MTAIVNLQDFLRNLGAFYASKGFQGYQSTINLVSELLPAPDLEGRLTTEQLAAAISVKVQEFGNNGNLPPWLRVVVQYYTETFGGDMLIENELDPATVPAVSVPNHKSPSPIKKRGYYGVNHRKHIPRYR